MAEAAPHLAPAQQSFQPANKNLERLSDGKITSRTELPAGAEMPVSSIASGKGAEKEGKNHRLNRILFGSLAMAALLGGGLYLLKRFVWQKLPLWLPVIIPLLIGFFCASLAGGGHCRCFHCHTRIHCSSCFHRKIFREPVKKGFESTAELSQRLTASDPERHGLSGLFFDFRIYPWGECEIFVFSGGKI